jgi:hypothetical protein
LNGKTTVFFAQTPEKLGALPEKDEALPEMLGANPEMVGANPDLETVFIVIITVY